MTSAQILHITEIAIEGFRGIAKGHIAGLAPLTILVGPNSSGKSAVLEALYLSVTNRPVEGLYHCVRRRPDLVEGVRWLFHDQVQAQVLCRLEATQSDGAKRDLVAKGVRSAQPAQQWGVLSVVGLAFPGKKREEEGLGSSMIPSRHTGPLPSSRIVSSAFAQYVPEVRFIESLGALSDIALTDRLTQAAEQGRRGAVNALLADVLDGALSLDVFTAGGTPYVGITLADSAIPLGAVGDGVQQLVRQSLELAALPGGLALVEEPESHKHPAALRATAKAIVGAVGRGVQVVLSTHSLELIDDLIDEASEDTLAKTALFRLRLEGGTLISSRLDGSDIRALRSDIQEDLR